MNGGNSNFPCSVSSGKTFRECHYPRRPFKKRLLLLLELGEFERRNQNVGRVADRS